jgi:hypothetical protein
MIFSYSQDDSLQMEIVLFEVEQESEIHHMDMWCKKNARAYIYFFSLLSELDKLSENWTWYIHVQVVPVADNVWSENLKEYV